MSNTKFKPGNPGKPKGAKNKVVVDIRERVTAFINANWEEAQNQYDQLEPRDKLAYLEKLMNYAIPKLAAVSNIIAFENMTDIQLDEIIDRLKN